MPDVHEGRIILVRHGETEANCAGCFADSPDIPLTAVGIQQAEELAGKLQQQFRASKVFSSEFRRARQTAEVIARRLNVNVVIFPGLEEREFGVLKGEPYKQMGVLMRNDLLYKPDKRWQWMPPSGESLEGVQARGVAALQSIHTSWPHEDVVVVSHGALMESVSAYISGGWENTCIPPNCGVLIVSSLALHKRS